MQRAAFVCAGLLVSACGAQVVFETDGGGGGGAGTTSSVAASQGSASSKAASSALTGGVDPCLGKSCGDGCEVCDGFGCMQGFCNEASVCAGSPPACAIHVLCYQPGPNEPCAQPANAAFSICSGCGGGKGCTFFGEILDGPWLTPDGCCYEVVGDCVANP